MSKPNAPPPPDYRGAAEATAAGDLAAARSQTQANRPDEFSPYGSRTWQQGTGSTFDEQGYQDELGRYNRYRDWYNQTGGEGGPRPRKPTEEEFTTIQDADKWVGTTTLNPEAQKAFEANQRMQTGLAQLGEQGVGQMGEIFSTPFSIEGAAPTYGEHRQGVVDAMMARTDAQKARDEESKRSTLVSQGIPVGSEAYAREMDRLDRQQTDARQQAEIAAEQMAGMGYSSALQGRGQGIQEQLLERQTPINEMSAFRTGSQVGMPQFQAYGQQQFTGGPNYAGATQQQGAYDMANYNADVAQNNAMWGGLAGLGSAGITAFSDKRLKKNIKRIGTSIMGFPVYAFDYIWGGDRQIGVMAQDVVKVMPEAVSTVAGYMAVDYGMIK